MRAAARAALTLAGVCALLVGVMSMSPGAGAAAPTSNHTYQFVDSNFTSEQCCSGFAIPKLPPGAYLVTFFAQLAPHDLDIPNESFGCSVSDGANGGSFVYDQVIYNGEFSPPLTASATYRVTKKSILRAGCSAERAPFHYQRPFQVNFTRLDSMQTIPVTGS
jgi:hypothetical protein